MQKMVSCGRIYFSSGDKIKQKCSDCWYEARCVTCKGILQRKHLTRGKLNRGSCERESFHIKAWTCEFGLKAALVNAVLCKWMHVEQVESLSGSRTSLVAHWHATYDSSEHCSQMWHPPHVLGKWACGWQVACTLKATMRRTGGWVSCEPLWGGSHMLGMEDEGPVFSSNPFTLLCSRHVLIPSSSQEQSKLAAAKKK